MGYSFYLISKDKEISETDFDKAIKNLSDFNRNGFCGNMPCDVFYEKWYVRVSGSSSVSGKYAEGFVLNLLMNLLDLDYKPRVISHDFKYGTEDDFLWLNNQ